MLKDKSLRYIFFVSLAIAVLFPLINIFIIYPLFSGLLIAEATDNAVNVARHLRPPAQILQSAEDLRAFLQKKPVELREDFHLHKIKVFSTEGEVLYSTDPSDIGMLNDKAYFHNVVAKGENFAKLVRKDSTTLEGERARLDVVETYVPVMEQNRFMGAFEIYADITASRERLENTIAYSSVIPFTASGGFMLMVLYLLRRACDDVSQRHIVEEELRFHKESLEHIVTERTAELKETNDALSHSERFLSTIFDSIHDPFCIFDREYRIVKVNNAYARIKGKKPGELIGRKCFEVLHGTSEVCEDCLVQRTFEAGTPVVKDKAALLPGGTEAWFELYSYPILSNEGTVTHTIEYSREVTDKKLTELERKRLIEELEQLSRTDALTGVLNRRALSLEIQDEFMRAVRYNKSLSLLLCDLDNLKDINDTYGHHAGDRALCRLADMFTKLLRQNDMAGRYGGDEFMVILPETDLEGAAVFAERLRATVANEAMDVFGTPVRMTLSIGVSSLSAGMKIPDDLIRPADAALYDAKSSGRNTVTIARAPANEADDADMQRNIPFD